MKMQKHWYLAVLGLVGIWNFPDVWANFQTESGSYWDLSNLLWFLWFLYLVPESSEEGAN